MRLQSAHLPGYNAALSSSLRDGPIRGQAAAFQSKGFEGKRVLIIHVRRCPTLPFASDADRRGVLPQIGHEGPYSPTKILIPD